MWDEERIQREAGSITDWCRGADLIDLGVTGREIAWRLWRGRIGAAHPGVYYVDSIPKTWKTMVMAAVMAAGPDAPLPPAVQQLRIGLPGGGNAYPDISWPDLMRIVEVDGFEAHGTHGNSRPICVDRMT